MVLRDTQLEAYYAIQDKIGDKQRTVLHCIVATGGQTLFELVRRLHQPVNRISGRVTELVGLGMVKDSGNRRKNPDTGKAGIVWVVCG